MALHSNKKRDQPRCAACKKDFKRRSELNRHAQQTHSDMRHSCPVLHCRFRVKRPGKVKTHLKTEHGIGQRKTSRETKRIPTAGVMAGSSTGLEYPPSTSLHENIITAGSNSFDPPQHIFQSTNTTECIASTETILGSGQWVQQRDTGRVQTPPQQLHIPQNRDYTNSSFGNPSTEHSSANDLLRATEMLSLDQDNTSNIVTSWMGDPFDDGWTINSWKP